MSPTNNLAQIAKVNVKWQKNYLISSTFAPYFGANFPTSDAARTIEIMGHKCHQKVGEIKEEKEIVR